MTWQEFIQKCTAYPPAGKMVVAVPDGDDFTDFEVADVLYDGEKIVITMGGEA